MQVMLSIADDRELRAHIRDIIKGEVIGIARGEIRGIIADVVKEGYVPKNADDLDKIVRGAIKDEVQKVLSSNSIGTWPSSAVKELAREEIAKMIHLFFRDQRLP